MKIILASASPRRRELLAQIGLEFTVCPSASDEVRTKQDPAELVEELAKQKAEEVAERLIFPFADMRDCVVIGADTIVACTEKDTAKDAVKAATKDVTKDATEDTANDAAKTVILGKPKDAADAKRMLRMLSGHTHQVYTGVTLIYADKNGAFHERVFHERTDVTVYPMTEEEIDRYTETGEPLDKAGAYGIQGRFAAYIQKIDGDYNNVVGLPVARVYQELKAVCANSCGND